MLRKIFDRPRSLIYRWIKQSGLCTKEPPVPGAIQEMEFDEMWHFVGSKKQAMNPKSP